MLLSAGERPAMDGWAGACKNHASRHGWLGTAQISHHHPIPEVQRGNSSIDAIPALIYSLKILHLGTIRILPRGLRGRGLHHEQSTEPSQLEDHQAAFARRFAGYVVWHGSYRDGLRFTTCIEVSSVIRNPARY